MAVVIDKNQLEKLKKKYPAISSEKLEEFFLEKCEKYSKMDHETKLKYGFEKGIKEEWNDQIKDFCYLIDEEKVNHGELDQKLDAWSIFSKKAQSKKLNDLQPYFYDKSGMFWLWNKQKFRWELSDDVDILNMIADATNEDIIGTKNRAEILNSLKQQGRRNMPKEVKKTWIQFKNKIVDYETGEEFEATPEYFVTNPIPHELSEFENTPTMDKIFTEWVGEDYVKTLYQILAYCLLPDYPLHRLFCFIGSGMNGKSKFLELMRRFIGEENVTSTELDTLIHSRFEITRLHKKLVCQMGETNFDELSKTSIIKKMTGQDTIGFEYKNKNPFDDYNYAKILIATNNLPTTTDKTLGFYRRWLIIDFPNQFSEARDILEDIPKEEYNALASKCVYLLKELLEKREFNKEGDIELKTKRYEAHSDFLQEFINSYTEAVYGSHITKADFQKKFDSWCIENGHRKVSPVTLGKKMKEKEYEWEKRTFDWSNGQVAVWRDIRWKE